MKYVFSFDAKIESGPLSIGMVVLIILFLYVSS